MKKFILATISAVALIFIIGSMGAFEQNNISMFQCAIQCIAGIAVAGICLLQFNK